MLRQRDAIMQLRHVFHRHQDGHGMAELFAQQTLRFRTPGRLQPRGLGQQRILARHLQMNTALEAARLVRFVEFVGIDRTADRPDRPVQLLREHAANIRRRMKHEIAAERRRIDAGRQQQARGSDAVAGDDDCRCRLQAIPPAAVAIANARGVTSLHHDLLHHAIGA
jgi:hypothetical protein